MVVVAGVDVVVPAGVDVVVVAGATVVVVGFDEVTVVATADVEQAVKTSRRSMPQGVLDVASAHHEAEEKASRRGPYQGKVIANGVHGGCSGYSSDGRSRNPANDPHQDGSEEIVGARKKASEETAYRPDTADDQHRLNRGCFYEHDDRLSRAHSGCRDTSR